MENKICAICGNPITLSEKPEQQDGVFDGWKDILLKDGTGVCKNCTEKTRIIYPLRSTKTFAHH